MTAEQTPDIEAVATLLLHHAHPGELLTGLGDAWMVCGCGERIDVEVVDGIAKTGKANEDWAAHVAQALAPVLAAERVKALREAALSVPMGPTPDPADYLNACADRIAVDAPEGGEGR